MSRRIYHATLIFGVWILLFNMTGQLVKGQTLPIPDEPDPKVEAQRDESIMMLADQQDTPLREIMSISTITASVVVSDTQHSSKEFVSFSLGMMLTDQQDSLFKSEGAMIADALPLSIPGEPYLGKEFQIEQSSMMLIDRETFRGNVEVQAKTGIDTIEVFSIPEEPMEPQ